MSHFSTALQIVIERNRMTQAQLASMAGVDAPLFSRYVNGKHRPSLEFLEKLCTALADEADRTEIVIGHLQDETPANVRQLIHIVNLVHAPRTVEQPDTEYAAKLPTRDEAVFNFLRKRASHDPNVMPAMRSIVAILRGQDPPP